MSRESVQGFTPICNHMVEGRRSYRTGKQMLGMVDTTGLLDD
jgi:hypothetical protein